jgi:hypothetical protein
MTEEQGIDLPLGQSLLRWLKDKGMQSIGIPFIAIIFSFIVTGHGAVFFTHLLFPLWKLLLTTVGTTLGVGFGLGLALNVHEELQAMRERQQNAEAASSGVDGTSSGIQRLKSGSSSGATLPNSWAGEESAYASLMTTAGYDATDHLLRGQVVKGYSKFFDKYYPFTDDPDWMKWRSVSLMKEQWPTLPEAVSVELGKFMEYVMRDFIASWYYYIDPAVVYEDERAKRKRMKQDAEQSAGSSLQQNGSLEAHVESSSSPPYGSKSSKAMIFSTARHRPAPMMSAIYQSLGIALGNLSTRVEGVNLFSMLLIKWTKVLSQTFKTYRHLRKAAVAKQRKPTLTKSRSSLRASQKQEERIEDPPQWGEISEMAVAREFMLKGKLHRAMTFGMDVPSLLFADAKGDACGVGNGATIDDLTDGRRPIEDQVLEQRLFGAKILYECEMDYNRVLSFRLVRALLPRAEFSSPIIRTMMTEMMAGCVLTPLMSSFCPEYLNGWIIMGCAETPADEGADTCRENGDGIQPTANAESLTANGDSDDAQDWSERGISSLPEDVDEARDFLSDLRHDKLQKSIESGEEMTLSQAELIAGAPSTDSADPVTGVEMTIGQALFFKPKEDGALFDDEGDVEVIDDLDESKRGDSMGLLDYEADEGRNNFGTSSSAAGGRDGRGLPMEAEKPLPTGDFVLPLLAMSMIDLQRFMEFTEAREAELLKQDPNIKWDDPQMQQSISQLVLVIEAALLHGRRSEKLMDDSRSGEKLDDNTDDIDHSDKAIEVAIMIESFSRVLMEITNDPDEFEDKILLEEEEYMDESPEETSSPVEIWQATPADLSTLRPLIAAWLHSGKAHRVMSVLINAQHSILKPFFHKHAFLRTQENADGFVRQLRQLNGVNILVDMTLALSSPNMDVNEDGNIAVPQHEIRPSTHPATASSTSVVRASVVAEVTDSTVSVRLGARFSLRADRNSENVPGTAPADHQSQIPALMTLPQAYVSSTGLPRFLDFRRNENFSSSLRADRERRMQSWASATTNDSAGHQIICRLKGGSDAAIAAHRELHQVARIFYAGTNLIALRNGARRKDIDSTKSVEGSDDSSEVIPISLLTVEMACQRRRLEVPDDDSSFLLRAQPRPLNAIGVHRDQRNHDMSFKCFAATFEEPAYRPGQTKYTGGRYVRKCMLRYFPNDRTAQVVLPGDTRLLDQRRKDGIVPASIDVGSMSSVPFLSGEFLKERHLCQKWTPKGATPRSGSILASSVMETSDFNSVPRSGKAIDFVYRLSLFERPMVELSGKRFTIHDSASTGPHRADASSLEISDASISIALLSIGADWQEINDETSAGGENEGANKPRRTLARTSSVEMGIDGYPIVWMKYTRKQGDSTVTEVKSYRASYVRAALMVTSARQDAQLQCLLRCVRAGSARSATKQRTEAFLQPTSKLLEYANSPEREKQSVLLRDLKLGMNNIDKAQLRRNGLLDPRYPTVIRHLFATCEGSGQVKDQHALAVPGMVPTITVYKIKCIALVALADTELSDEETEPFGSPPDSSTALFREEWVIFRPMKDIQVFHKHMKTQIAPTEQSASAGARLVGAAAAAFAASSTHGGHRRRKTLLPSLNQAQKQLGVSKKAIQKRCEVLDDYLKQLLAEDHPLNRCSELLMFLGAFYPFPPDVKLDGEPVTNKTDPLGRMEMKRVAIHGAVTTSTSTLSAEHADAGAVSAGTILQAKDDALAATQSDPMNDLSMAAASPSSRSLGTDTSMRTSVSFRGVAPAGGSVETTESAAAAEERKTRVKEIDMIPSIKAKIDEVPLAKVRAALFDLVRYQFDFDNANFFRNRMFSALKTMSFAVATPGEFRKMLYEAHMAHINAEALAGWVKFITDLIFPDGVFCEFSAPTSEEELQRLAREAKQLLPKAFPDQLRAVLGPEIVQGGLDMLHEMLQNRLILKSMAYMLFDLLWLEIFPELHDILTGSVALETDY